MTAIRRARTVASGHLRTLGLSRTGSHPGRGVGHTAGPCTEPCTRDRASPGRERSVMSTALADVAAEPPADVASQPVTRVEILECIEEAFADGPVDRSRLVDAARARGARAELVALLEHLPERHYVHQRQLWVDLPHVPVGL